MITAVLPVVFTSSFGMNTPSQTSKGICTRLTVGKEVCSSFGRRKHVARHRNYRLVLSLRSRYRQKTNNRLPPKNYRHNLVLAHPPKSLPPKNEKPPNAEKLPPYGTTAENLPQYFGFTASAKVFTAKKDKTAYRRKVTACVRPKKRYRR